MIMKASEVNRRDQKDNTDLHYAASRGDVN